MTGKGMVLFLCAVTTSISIVYGMDGDWRRAIYWLLVTGIQIVVTI